MRRNLILMALVLSGCGQSLEEKVKQGDLSAIKEASEALISGDNKEVYSGTILDALLSSSAYDDARYKSAWANVITDWIKSNYSASEHTCRSGEPNMSFVESAAHMTPEGLDIDTGLYHQFFAYNCIADSMLFTGKQAIEAKDYRTALINLGAIEGNDTAIVFNDLYKKEASYLAGQIRESNLTQPIRGFDHYFYYKESALSGNREARRSYHEALKNDKAKMRYIETFYNRLSTPANTIHEGGADIIDELAEMGMGAYRMQTMAIMKKRVNDLANGRSLGKKKSLTELQRAFTRNSDELTKRGYDMQDLDRQQVVAVMSTASKWHYPKRAYDSLGWYAKKYSSTDMVRAFQNEADTDFETLMTDPKKNDRSLFSETGTIRQFSRLGHEPSLKATVDYDVKQRNQDELHETLTYAASLNYDWAVEQLSALESKLPELKVEALRTASTEAIQRRIAPYYQTSGYFIAQ
ncbi:hypothetical protein ACPV5W_16015 [Vibrio astriarenae]